MSAMRPPRRGDQVITQVFELHNESANNVLPVLRPLISPNNTIAAYPANNTLVVTDYADNVRRIASIIAGIDTAAGRQVDVVPLKNANALDVAEQLNKLLDPGSIGSTDATLKVTVTADPRTNSLMLRASSGARLAAAKQLAHKLDAATTQPGNMHVVALRNADATRLAKTLRAMMGKGGDNSSSSSGSRVFEQFRFVWLERFQFVHRHERHTAAAERTRQQQFGVEQQSGGGRRPEQRTPASATTTTTAVPAINPATA